MSQTDTKQKILDAAEHLFAREGFHCTSLRRITGTAGVNLAAVNYHFGSKEALLEEVLRRRLDPLNRERNVRLEAVREDARQKALPPTVADALRAFLEPTMALRDPASGASDFVVLVGRGLANPGGAVGECFLRMMHETALRLYQLLCAALPDTAPEVVFWRMQFAIGAMSHTLRWAGNFPGLPATLQPTEETAELTERLLRFIVLGMEGA